MMVCCTSVTCCMQLSSLIVCSDVNSKSAGMFHVCACAILNLALSRVEKGVNEVSVDRELFFWFNL